MAAQPYRLALYQDMRNQLELHQNRRHPWFTGDLLGKLPPAGNGSIDRLHLDRQLRESVERSPLPLYLRIEDRNAMASSVEIRVPFLDYRLVELLFSAPGEYKMRGPFNKYIIREAMRGRIPDSVRGRQEKMGFPSPAGIWMSELEGNIRDMLASRFASEIGVFNLPRIRRDFDLHCKGERQIGSETFNVLQFLIWHQNNNQNVAEAGA
jgi:asparagine synthase (glutamine-hydrolysing)